LDVPENLWLERARAGDRLALGRLLEFYKPACYCFALNLAGHADAAAAEDLCKEAFLLAMLTLYSPETAGTE
jgi:DNA-directed RNA polymerase specialized sigma24 family protein